MGDPSILSELKRRGVLKAGVWYCSAGFILLQVVDMFEEPLGFPGWALKATIIALVLGLPALLACSWFFDLTFAGFVRTEDAVAADAELHPGLTDRWLWLGLGTGLMLGLGVVQSWRSYTDPGLIPTGSLEAFNKAERDLTAARQIRDPALQRESALSAATQLEQIVDDSPKWPRAWSAMADVQALLAESPGESFLEHREAAREALDEAFELAPEDREVLVRRARFLIELDDDPAGAATLLRPLADADLRDPAALMLLATALADLGRWPERAALGERWSKSDPDSADALLVRAGARVALAYYDEAAGTYERAAAIQRNPSLTLALERALLPLHARGDVAAFAAALEADKDRFSSQWQWTRMQVAAALAQGDVETAARLVESSTADDWPVAERDVLRALVAHAEGDQATLRSAGPRALAALEAASDVDQRPRTLAERLAVRAHLHGLLGERQRGLTLLGSAESLVRADDQSAQGVALRHTLALAWRACGESGRMDQHLAWLATHPTPRSSARTLVLVPGVPP